MILQLCFVSKVTVGKKSLTAGFEFSGPSKFQNISHFITCD